MSRRVLGRILLNGRHTCERKEITPASYEGAMPQKSANYWASTENGRGVAWLVNSYVGGTLGGGKYGSQSVRAAVAFTFNL